MCKDYCDYENYPECCEDEYEEITVEELIEDVIEDIENGECLKCSLFELFNIAYELGRKDVAESFMGLSQDILDEDFDEE